MPVDLGRWSWAVEMALDFGAPALAAAFHIPGPVSDFAVGTLKSALGLKPTASAAETQAAANNVDPEVAKAAIISAQSEVSAKYQYLTRLAEVQAEVNKVNVTQVNETIRSETAQGVPWHHWRHLIGYAVIFQGLVFFVSVIKDLWLNDFAGIDASIRAATALTPYFITMAGLLGYVAQDTTALRTAAITGQPVPGILSSVVAAVTPKKK